MDIIYQIWASVYPYIEGYLPIIFEVNTVMAIVISWVIIHYIKSTRLVTRLDRSNERDARTRLLAIAIAFILLVFFKRHDSFDKMLNANIFMAAISPYVYKWLYNAIKWKFPEFAKHMVAKVDK